MAGQRRGEDVITRPIIEVFADIVCPFTHVGLRRLVERRNTIGFGSLLRVRAWPLELVNGEPLDAAFVGDEVRELRDQVAPDLFEGFDESQFPQTSLPALALASAAYAKSPALGERMSLALRTALFEDGRNIASPAVLDGIAREHGLALSDTLDRTAVLADWDDGRRRGVMGSPHFFIDDEGFFCPALDITREGEHLRITRDEIGFRRFLARAFPTA